MNIAITKKIDFMANKIRTGFLLIAVLSSIIVLSACSTNSERRSEVDPTPVSVPSDITSESTVESEVTSEIKVKALSATPSKPKSVVKPDSMSTTKNKASKPSITKKRVKKVDKKKAVSKKAVNQKAKVKKSKVEKKVVDKPTVEVIPFVAQMNAIKKTEEYRVDLAKLPLLIGSNWTLSRDANSDGQCALSYRKVVMGDGQGETPVFFIITQDKVLFKTKSNIDMSYKQTGLTIDDQPQLPIEKLHNDFSISYEMQYQSLVDRMKTGEQAVLTLGFWPSWPVTHTYSLNLGLGEFSAAQWALKTCLELEKELK